MSPRHQPPNPSEVAIRSERSAYAEGIPPGDVTASCRGPVRVCAEYDDHWRTPVTMAPLRITDINGVALDGGARTQGLPSFGMQDGDEIDGVRSELGRFALNDAARGPVTVELVPDPSAASEVDALSRQITSVLNGFKSEMETALLPWITDWNDRGILSIPQAYRSGQLRGLSEWWDGEKDFWAAVGGWISNAFKAAVNATVQAANDLRAWYDDLPWYGKISPAGYWLVQQVGNLFESAAELWERRDQIMALVKAFAEGAVNGIENALEALKDLPGEIGELIALLVDQSAEWVGALIEMIRETDVIEELFTSMVGIVMMMPPNLWAEALGTVEGYLLPEVLLAIVFAVIAALSAGAGSAALAARLATFVTKVRAALVALGKIGPLLLKIFGKLDEIGGLIVKLVRALKRKIEEIAQGATDVDIRIVRSTRKWRSRDVNGRRVYQRDDLFDPDYVDPNTGLTNKQLMEEGLAPIGPDGRPINLHHMTQDEPGPMAEVAETFHRENNRALHMYTNQYDKTWVGPDGVRRPYTSAPASMNRSEFNRWKEQYWIDRAKDF